MFRKILSVLLCVLLMITPFAGVITFTVAAATTDAPTVTVSIAPYATVAPTTSITVTFAAQGDNTLSTCKTRLEGKSIGTTSTVTFTPQGKGLTNGAYTLMMEAKDSAGNVTYQPLTFYVSDKAPLTAVSGVTQTTLAVEALSFEAGYAATTNGTLDLSAVKPYDADAQYAMQYGKDPTALTSVSGIPYQVFDVDLAGKTSGNVTLYYEGFTKVGERIALKAYNPSAKTWDTLGTLTGEGSVSASVNIATYNDGGVIHAAAVLDYVTNGSDTILWSTDPQHYTKFEDLHEYYYEIYRYAAQEYQNGNAGYILTTGDIVDDVPGSAVTPKQWDVADQAMSYVEAVGMPNGIVSGNHDVNNSTADYSLQLEHFPASRYNNERWFGGSLNNNVSHYDLITIGNVDFVVLFLGYGKEATNETVAWANDVLRTYRHRTAIVATHQYLNTEKAQYANKGQQIFNKIVDPNPNVKMVLCGHDEGSVRRETVASDGRIVHEILSDYQFTEAEDPEFYANEHWIGAVEKCNGDGYIRLMSVEGNKLSSITYSPVTGRYNPMGDPEVFTIDLGDTTPDRSLTTTRFAAAVVGEQTSSTTVDRITRYSANGAVSYSAVTYATVPAAPAQTDGTAWPQTTYGAAATPSNPTYARAAKTAPQVSFKVDVLETLAFGEHPAFNKTTTFGDYALNLKIDLSLTPYLYYSFAVPSNTKFTFAFINETTTAPWLTFLDANKGGATMNTGAENWNAYAGNGSQYFTGSVTGCIDMRTLTKTADAAVWEVEQLNIYNPSGKDVVFSYLFFGSKPISSVDGAYGEAGTPARPAVAHGTVDAPIVSEKINVLEAVYLNDNAIVYEWVNYGNNALNLKVDLNKTPYLYYSFSQSADSKFTFGLINDTANAPWLTYLDGKQDGSRLNGSVDDWNNGGGKKYFTTSMTGCIDMRQYVKDPANMTWEVDQLNLYNQNKVPVTFHYLFFGSVATGGDEPVSVDAAALGELIAEANAIDTAPYTAASVSALTKAKQTATYADRSDTSAVSRAYAALERAIAALTTPVTDEVDASTLVSLKNYPLTLANWKCASSGAAVTDTTKSFMTMEAVTNGMRMTQSSVATHRWPSIKYAGSGASYTVQPYGGVYLKLKLDAQSAWAINLTVTQDGKQTTIRLNCGIINSFDDPSNNTFAGSFHNVYDVSEAFYAFGVDPTATFTVDALAILAVGGGTGWNTYTHLELLTGKPTSSSYTTLNKTIAYAKKYTKSLYTSASWTTMQSALTAAQTAASTSGLTQPAINLANHRLQTAMDGLVLNKALVPYGSLLPDDKGLWQAESAATVTYGADGNPVVRNTNGTYAYADYTFDARYITVKDHALKVDVTIGSYANILLFVDGKQVSISTLLSKDTVAGDAPAGEYRVNIPLSSIPELKGKVAVDISGIRVYAVGAAAKSDVTIRTLGIDDYCTHTLNPTITTYGPAATPTNPSYTHAAKNAPLVGKKVDVLAACGLDHPRVTEYATYGDQIMHLTVDLNETPYLYYSIAQSDASSFTFGFYNNADTAPWFTFVDATKGATTMNQGVDNWDAYTGQQQYFSGSISGCIDMRKLATGDTWMINQVVFYTGGTKDATVSYLFFGSEALSDGYIEEEALPGDVDLNGKVDTVDAREFLRAVLTGTQNDLSDAQKLAADLNGDAVLNTMDIRRLLQMLVS